MGISSVEAEWVETRVNIGCSAFNKWDPDFALNRIANYFIKFLPLFTI